VSLLGTWKHALVESAPSPNLVIRLVSNAAYDNFWLIR
jgi:hypothetical protein